MFTDIGNNKMAKFDFSVEVFMGCTCSGAGVYESGCGSVELKTAEVLQLVDLMEQHNSCDVKTLKLRKTFPRVYKKLRDAYHNVAYRANALHWLGKLDFEECEGIDALIEYCEANYGYKNNDSVSCDTRIEKDAERKIMKCLMDLKDECSINFIKIEYCIILDDGSGKTDLIPFTRDEYTPKEQFKMWLKDFLKSVDNDELHTIFIDYLGFDSDVFELERKAYKISIPEAIVKMANLSTHC